MTATVTKYQLAIEFSRQLCIALTAEQIDTVIELNGANQNPNICHSHDFCDANQVMLDALAALGLPDDAAFAAPGRLSPLVGSAWQIAKDHDFSDEDIRNTEAILNDC